MREDLAYALRSLGRNHAFTLTVLLTLALGVGANTAIFSVVRGVVLRSLPYPHSERLVRVYSYNRELLFKTGASIPDYLDWKAQAQSFEALEVFRSRWVPLEEDPDSGISLFDSGISLFLTTPGLLELIGARPTVGRLIRDEDILPDAPRTAVLSHQMWVGRYGGNPEVIGQTVRLGGDSYTIVGVAEPITGPMLARWEVILPWIVKTDRRAQSRGIRGGLQALGRLKEGVTLEQAQAELDAIGASLSRQYPDTNARLSPLAVSVYEETVSGVRPALLALLGATLLILLLAVANIANLFLARGSTRYSELSIRSALGATPRQLARLLLLESLLLSLLGGLAGVAIGYGLVQYLLALSPPWIPRLGEIDIDATVQVSALAAIVMAGLIFGLVPLMSVRSQSLQTGMQWTARQQPLERSWPRSALVVAQLALSLVLLTGAGLMIRSFLALQNVPIGIDYRQIVTFSEGGLGVGPFGEKRIRDLQRFRYLLEHIEAISGVVDATLTSQPPLSGSWGATEMEVLTGAARGKQVDVDLVGVNPDFFRFFGSRPLEGRLFEADDRQRADSLVVVDANLAARIWGEEESAVGQRLKFGEAEAEVIGVSEPIRYGDLAKEMRPKLYNLLDHSRGAYGGTFLIRHQGRAEAIMEAIKARLAEVDGSMLLRNLQPLEAQYEQYLRWPRFYLVIVGSLGVLGLLVAAVGVFGVVSYSVGRRTSEVGIRMALGATRPAIVKMFCRHTALHLALGLAAGVLGSLWLTRYLRSLLFEVEPTDPVALVSMALLLSVTSLLATLIPARRALGVDPATTLRSE